MSKMFFQLFPISVIALIAMACSVQGPSAHTDSSEFNLVPDVRTLCKEVSEKYTYFEARADYWEETCKRAEIEASLLKGKSGSLAVLERMIDDLYDPHISLNTANQKSPRLVPSGSDIWFSRIGEAYISTAVRPFSGAAKAGITVGDQLVRFNGMTPTDLAFTRMHSGTFDPSDDRMTWAINAAIAGNRTDPRNIEIRRGDEVLLFSIDRPDVPQSKDPITYRQVSDRVGYIRFNNSLDNSDTVSDFDEALNEFRQSDGLILDLRDTPGGGNTGVAEPIMGRFIKKKAAYQRTVLNKGSKRDRKLKPRGPWTYEKPVIVLVGRWTGSMGEGIAIGFDGMGRGNVIGSKMAGLAGGTESVKLKERRVSISFPAYDLHHLNGTPRHNWQPSEIVVADNGDEEDILLQSAILMLSKKLNQGN